MVPEIMHSMVVMKSKSHRVEDMTLQVRTDADGENIRLYQAVQKTKGGLNNHMEPQAKSYKRYL